MVLNLELEEEEKHCTCHSPHQNDTGETELDQLIDCTHNIQTPKSKPLSVKLSAMAGLNGTPIIAVQ